MEVVASLRRRPPLHCTRHASAASAPFRRPRQQRLALVPSPPAPSLRCFPSSHFMSGAGMPLAAAINVPPFCNAPSLQRSCCMGLTVLRTFQQGVYWTARPHTPAQSGWQGGTATGEGWGGPSEAVQPGEVDSTRLPPLKVSCQRAACRRSSPQTRRPPPPPRGVPGSTGSCSLRGQGPHNCISPSPGVAAILNQASLRSNPAPPPWPGDAGEPQALACPPAMPAPLPLPPHTLRLCPPTANLTAPPAAARTFGTGPSAPRAPEAAPA